MKNLIIAGATGSIGRSTLDVVRRFPNLFHVSALSAHGNQNALLTLGREFPDARLCLTGTTNAVEGIDYIGPEGLKDLIRAIDAEMVVNGIAGSAGLPPSVWALEKGLDLALANKETVVMAAPQIFELAALRNAAVIPVDSEHSAVFFLLRNQPRRELEEIILTASGGAFRDKSLEEIRTATVADALAHPTWDMGAKITIDSASLANKGLEVIEAYRLFDIPLDRIKVLIHPQSLVHSLIRVTDGSLYAQISRPDMRLPIQNALSFPEMLSSPFGRLDLAGESLDFRAPDTERFPMLALAYQAAQTDGTAPLIYNAANEAAVAAFIEKKIAFHQIPRFVAEALATFDSGALTDISAITRYNQEVYQKTRELMENI